MYYREDRDEVKGRHLTTIEEVEEVLDMRVDFKEDQDEDFSEKQIDIHLLHFVISLKQTSVCLIFRRFSGSKDEKYLDMVL